MLAIFSTYVLHSFGIYLAYVEPKIIYVADVRKHNHAFGICLIYDFQTIFISRPVPYICPPAIDRFL